MKSTIAALDFGTGKIVTLVAETSGNHRCDIIGAGLSIYDGFMESNWNNPDELNDAIQRSITEAESQSHRKIRDINVGVPGEFTKVYAVVASVVLQGADPQVTPKDVEAIFEEAERQIQPLNGIIIHRSPAWFMVDTGKKTLEPVGQRGAELKAMICYVVAHKYFLDDVLSRLRTLGYTVSGFFSSCTGEAMLYLLEQDRDHIAVLIDVGYLCTDVMIVEGDALIFHETLEVGGGHIAADLSEGLSIPLEAAEKIKRDYVFNVSALVSSTTENGYTVSVDGGVKTQTFSQEEVSAVLEPRVDELAEMIEDSLTNSGVKLGNWSNLFLTGGGITLNRGGRDYLSTRLHRPVKETVKRTLKLSSPIYASSMGLLDLIIDMAGTQASNAGGIKGFFQKLWGE